MSTLGVALTAARLTGEHPAWGLLRARNAPVAVAVLGTHLGGEHRRLAAPVLFDRIEEDLAVLRDNGFDLPRTAQAYCADWLAERILVRRAADGVREETYELSDGALVAIRFVADLAEPRQSVTESRLTNILERVRRLALETDPDVTTRLAALQSERRRIDDEIARVEAGDVDVLDTDRALERARDILATAEEIPADFARVRAEMERINRGLRQMLIEEVDSRGTVLDDVFRGVDHLAESDAGRSFNGFFSLILDPERSTAFEDDVSNLLERPFTVGLSPAQARLLRRLLPTLQDHSAEIHDVMTAFSRSLRRFVQSQELQEDRVLNRALQAAQRDALALADQVAPYSRTSLHLQLTSVSVDSVATLVMHNPADSQTAQDVLTREAEPVDIARLHALMRIAEIDLKELRRNVNDVLADVGAVTIADVLTHRPASQGVASVVGLLVLAERHAAPLDGHEQVEWHSDGGVARHGTVPRHLFKEPIT